MTLSVSKQPKYANKELLEEINQTDIAKLRTSIERLRKRIIHRQSPEQRNEQFHALQATVSSSQKYFIKERTFQKSYHDKVTQQEMRAGNITARRIAGNRGLMEKILQITLKQIQNEERMKVSHNFDREVKSSTE